MSWQQQATSSPAGAVVMSHHSPTVLCLSPFCTAACLHTHPSIQLCQFSSRFQPEIVQNCVDLTRCSSNSSDILECVASRPLHPPSPAWSQQQPCARGGGSSTQEGEGPAEPAGRGEPAGHCWAGRGPGAACGQTGGGGCRNRGAASGMSRRFEAE